MKRSVAILSAAVLMMSQVTFVSAQDKNTKIVLEGSTTVLPIAQKAAGAFMSIDPRTDISVLSGGSGVGIASIIDGKCDIADSSRPIKDAELAKAVDKGKDIKPTIIAMDGIAIIVNPKNPVSNLSKQQVIDIFTGKILNWSQVGGKDEKIMLVSRDSSSGTYEAFDNLALGGQKIPSDTPMLASNQAVDDFVSKTPGAVGYAGLGYVTQTLKAVSIDGITASRITVMIKKYPYSRPLFMYTNGQPQGTVKQFIDFILSRDGQKIVAKEGFVPLK